MTMESPRVKYRRLPHYKYQTCETLVFLTDICPNEDIIHPYFTIQKDGMVTVNAGYSYDGASGPSIDTKSFMRGSLIHDVFFQAHQFRLGLPIDWMPKANDLLIRICKEDGMSSIRCWWVHKAVTMFGRGLPKDLNPFEEVLIAP